ncbi:hypothetical protein FK178_13055 [Antarcticibacterium arcticum]|uniref:Beta-galactosidase trimerisation domain-containing protein n=1 Tax=Antarcticibacterium arcticum TaxID=2585771 RepID=A0A5B8YMU2_9FLAO|nr:beta-galactosidase [Antarcticibacterium arcticum]QED38588.1 hypothetical protein FK178_13055 [Antarcticibacterium arcticum]
MKRRKFISISGIALTSSLLPVMTARTLGYFGTGGKAKIFLPPDASKPTWINTEPLRLAWSHLSPQHASADPEAVFDKLVEADFNCIMNTAVDEGAYYPSNISFNEACPALPEGGDLYGDLAKLARQNNMRTGARFDFTHQSKEALAAHPEWFIRHKDGSTVTDAEGRAKPCLNSNFYPIQAVNIISEVLENYEPDIVYINWFLNFGGHEKICYCESCEHGFLQKYGRPLPDEPDADFIEFIEEAADNSSRIIANAIFKKRPGTLYINADENDTSHGHHLETHAGDWIYSSSEQINRQRVSYPGRVGIDQWFSYSGDPSEFDSNLVEEMKVRYYQFGAHGSPISFCTQGTLLSPSHQVELEEAARMNAWYKENADLYGLQLNRSRVLLLCSPETSPRSNHTNKGIYALMTELHIPVAVSENPDSLINASQDYDLVIVTPGAMTDGLEEYVEKGGRALFIDRPPSFGIPSNLELAEKPVHIIRKVGKGQISFFGPWDISEYYKREAPLTDVDTFSDMMDSLLLNDRQIITNAPPRVEMVFMYQPDQQRSLLHLINCSGKTREGFQKSETFQEINIDLAGEFSLARARVIESDLKLSKRNGRSLLSLPVLNDYEVIELRA